MRQCRNCGEEIKDEARYCPYCGSSQKKLTEEQRAYENSAIGSFHMEEHPVSRNPIITTTASRAKGAVWCAYLKICTYLIAIVEFVAVVRVVKTANAWVQSGWVTFLGIVVGAIIAFTSISLSMMLISVAENIVITTDQTIQMNKKLDRLSNK